MTAFACSIVISPPPRPPQPTVSPARTMRATPTNTQHAFFFMFPPFGEDARLPTERMARPRRPATGSKSSPYRGQRVAPQDGGVNRQPAETRIRRLPRRSAFELEAELV